MMEHIKGLFIDSIKFVISAIILLYGWYILATIGSIQPLTVEQLLVVHQEQIVYSYYITLGLVAIIAYIVDYFYYKYQFTPSYSKPFTKTNLTIALFFSMLFILAGLTGIYRTEGRLITEVIYSVPLAIAHGVKGVIENMFFIGLIGFSIWRLFSSKSEYGSMLLAAVVVGLIAVAWHLYKLLYIYSVTQTVVYVVPTAISVFIFFFIGTLISIFEDKTWTWDIVHFIVNFSIGLLGAKAYLIL